MAEYSGLRTVDSDAVRRQWAERSGEFSPRYYAHYGPNGTSDVLLDIFDRFVDRDAAILELGCSSGRHLSHLHQHGFENLAGIEINEDAFDVMADAYPALAASGTFYPGAIEEVVTRFDDCCFDAIFSVETLQHLHPDTDWVFEELSRITNDLLVTVENEGGNNGTETATSKQVGTESNREGPGTDQQETDTSREGAAQDVDTSHHADAKEAATQETTTEQAVNYVNGDVPLYYRNWNDIFTERGFEQLDVRSGDRDTVRTFRASRE